LARKLHALRRDGLRVLGNLGRRKSAKNLRAPSIGRRAGRAGGRISATHGRKMV
jgi:hypothetical protein